MGTTYSSCGASQESNTVRRNCSVLFIQNSTRRTQETGRHSAELVLQTRWLTLLLLIRRTFCPEYQISKWLLDSVHICRTNIREFQHYICILRACYSLMQDTLTVIIISVVIRMIEAWKHVCQTNMQVCEIDRFMNQLREMRNILHMPWNTQNLSSSIGVSANGMQIYGLPQICMDFCYVMQ